MKRLLFFSLFLLCILSITVSAANISVSMQGDGFFAGQTATAKVSMQNFAVSKLSLLDNSGAKLGIGFFYYGYGNNEYLVYFNLPSAMAAGNYSLSATDRVMEEGELKTVSSASSFGVEQGTSVFAISPAILKVSSASGSFKIDLRHTSGSAATASVSVTDTALKPVRTSISVSSGETKSLFVNYDYSKLKGDTVLKLSAGDLAYDIQLLVPKQNATAPINATLPVNQTKPVPPAANMTTETNGTNAFENAIQSADNLTVIKNKVAKDQSLGGVLRFRNAYSSPLSNIAFSSVGIPGLSFNTTLIPAVAPGEIFTQYILINKNKNAEQGKYFGDILVKSEEGASLIIQLEIEIGASAAGTGSLNQTSTQPGGSTSIPSLMPLNLSLNYTDMKQANEAERSKNLKIALIIIAAVFLIILLLAIRLRPITKYRHMQQYATEKRESNLPKAH